MKRTTDIDAMYRTQNVKKNLERFATKHPEAAPFCEFDEYSVEEIAKALPITDKYWADGSVNDDWTYYFDIDFDNDGMYVWFIERTSEALA